MSVKVSITVEEGPDEGQTIELESGELTIGRNRANFVLTDKKVSGKHCVVRLDGNRVILEDLGSTNGTFVRGRKIDSPVEVRNLEEVYVGLTKLTFAIVEDVAEFKRANQKSKAEVSPESESFEEDAGEIRPPDAGYRTTGIKRIENLIQDEMATFSKWDHPAVAGKENLVKVRVNLSVKRGPQGITEFTCTQAVTTMGRKGCDIRLNDIDCSRKHAAIEIVGSNKVYVRDLASTNGTYVNGKRVAFQEIASGDMIQIGGTVMEVTVESAES